MELQARASATDELMASGALDDMTGSSKDSLTRELEELSSGSDVENELAQLKAQIGGGAQRPMLDQGGQGTGDLGPARFDQNQQWQNGGQQ